MFQYLNINTDSILNYVECGKLILWKESTGFQISINENNLAYSVVSVLLCINMFLFSYWTNRLDVGIIEATE
jgi:hypothetical protein